MADRIRFDSARKFWWQIASCLDPESTTAFNNWEAVAEQLDFKPREINHIKALKDRTGSNTMIMFNRYVEKTDGGDLYNVMHILQNLNRSDALEYLMSNVAEIQCTDARNCEKVIEHHQGCVDDVPMGIPEPLNCLNTQHKLVQQQQLQQQPLLKQHLHQPHIPQHHLQQQYLKQQHGNNIHRNGQHQIQYQHIPEPFTQHQPMLPQSMQHCPQNQDARQRMHLESVQQQQLLQQQKDMHQHPRPQRPSQNIQLHQYNNHTGHAQYGVDPAVPYSLRHPSQQSQPMLNMHYQPGLARMSEQPVPDQQMVYQPTVKQMDSIAQKQRSKWGVNGNPGMPLQHQHHRNTATPQEKPMNLKKPSAPGPEFVPYHNFNKRTGNDFRPGLGMLYARDSNPSMEVQCHDRQLSSMNPTLSYQSVPGVMVERPTDFPEVLIRGENNLDSLSQSPVVIVPFASSPEPQHRIHDHRAFHSMDGVEDSLISHSDVHFPILPPDIQGSPGISPEPMDYNYSTVPLTIYPLKQEHTEEITCMDTAFPATTDHMRKHNLTQDPGEPFHQVPVRETVIQKAPQCNSDAAAYPGDLARYPELMPESEDDNTEQRVNSFPSYPVQRPHAKEIRKKCNLARLTWPLSEQDIQQRKLPSPTPSRLITQRHVTSTDKDFKPHDQQKKPIKVLLTYTLIGKQAKTHKKEITVLYNCLLKNGFVPSLDFMDPREFAQDIYRWMDTRFTEAQFILVCISPQYKMAVEYPDASSSEKENLYTRSCRYVHTLMRNEFTKEHCQNKRFKPVLLPGAELHHVPMWMQSTVAFRWRENWKDIMYMMLEPDRILSNMRNNKEKFAKSEPVIKITQRSM